MGKKQRAVLKEALVYPRENVRGWGWHDVVEGPELQAKESGGQKSLYLCDKENGVTGVLEN